MEITKDTNKKNIIIFFFPLSGISLVYKKLIKFFPNASVYFLHYPFKEKSANFLFSSLKDLAKNYQEIIKELTKNYDNVFFVGYSFGGLMALESALMFNQQGHKIKELIIIDTIYPSLLKDDNLFDQIIQRLIKKIDFNFLDLNLSYFKKIVENNYHLQKTYTPKKYNSLVTFITTLDTTKNNLRLWRKNVFDHIKIIKIAADHYSIIEDKAEHLGQALFNILSKYK